MRRLSEHFTDEELRVADAPFSVMENAVWLCANVLEPTREHFGAALSVTSGYRPPDRNAATGGVKNSYHLYEGDHCAADFLVAGVSVEELFDWLRLKSKLPFSKVILEKDHTTGLPTIVHVQAHAGITPEVRIALVGETHGTAGYSAVECV